MKVTIKDIARLANVSVATVSKVMNKKDEDISELTRQKVLEIAKKENYIPNLMARSLVTKKTNTIGLIIPDISNPFFPELARGAEDKANELGYSMIICNTDNDVKKEKKYVKMLAEKMIDGVILTQSLKTTGEEDVAASCSFPMVLVDRDVTSPFVKGKLIVNDFKGSYLATKYLIDKNHKEILFIGGPQKIKNTSNRYNGYVHALKESNLILKESYADFGEYNSEFGYKSIKNYIEKKIPFSAVVCGNDLIAIGVIKRLKEHGIKVPKEVAVLGFDDIYLAQYIEPALSTVALPSYDMGVAAVELLINSLENKHSCSNSIEIREMNTILKIRESS